MEFKFKKDKIEPPDIYLVARLARKTLNGKQVWTMCSRDYIKLAIQNIESRLTNMGMKLPGKVTTYQCKMSMHLSWTLVGNLIQTRSHFTRKSLVC